jgi:hypothetical protein
LGDGTGNGGNPENNFSGGHGHSFCFSEKAYNLERQSYLLAEMRGSEPPATARQPSKPLAAESYASLDADSSGFLCFLGSVRKLLAPRDPLQ